MMHQQAESLCEQTAYASRAVAFCPYFYYGMLLLPSVGRNATAKSRFLTVLFRRKTTIFLKRSQTSTLIWAET